MDNTKTCPICYNNINVIVLPHDYIMTECNHFYHKKCIYKMYDNNIKTCSICRANIDYIKIINNYILENNVVSNNGSSIDNSVGNSDSINNNVGNANQTSIHIREERNTSTINYEIINVYRFYLKILNVSCHLIIILLCTMILRKNKNKLLFTTADDILTFATCLITYIFIFCILYLLYKKYTQLPY